MKYAQFKDPHYGYISVIGREDDELEWLAEDIDAQILKALGEEEL